MERHNHGIERFTAQDEVGRKRQHLPPLEHGSVLLATIPCLALATTMRTSNPRAALHFHDETRLTKHEIIAPSWLDEQLHFPLWRRQTYGFQLQAQEPFEVWLRRARNAAIHHTARGRKQPSVFIIAR